MKFISQKFFLIALLSLFFSAALSQQAGAEALKLSFHEKTQTEALPNALQSLPGTEGVKAPGATAQDVIVTLYPKSFAVEGKGQSSIYDFESRQLTVLDHSAKTAISFSLYSLPVFKFRESLSRRVMNKQIAAIVAQKKIDHGIPDIQDVDIDMIYGTNKGAAGTAAEISKKTQGAVTSFSTEKRALASYSLSEQKIPENLKDSYRKFIIYENRVHPVIQAALGNENYVFKTLSFETRDNAIVKSDYSLIKAEMVQGDSFVFPADYKKNLATNPRLNAAMEKSLAAPAPTIEAYKAKITGYVNQFEYMDALLGLNEMILMYPADLPQYQEFFKSTYLTVTQDSQVAQTMQVIRQAPQSEEELIKAVKFLEAMKGRTHEYVYLLDLYAANHIRTIYGRMNSLKREQFDQLSKTTDMFLTALEGNPWLAGGYVDIGSAYFGDYDTPLAWMCWDHARKLDPDFDNLKGVQGYEASALKDFPEYF